MGLIAHQGSVLDVQERYPVLHLGHFRVDVDGPEIRGPVRVDLELHARAALGDVLVAELAVDRGELPPVVVQEEVDAVR